MGAAKQPLHRHASARPSTAARLRRVNSMTRRSRLGRYRGIGPEPEAQYFRGSVQVYRLDRVQAWLAARDGLPYDQDQAWSEALRRIHFDPTPDVRFQVQRLVELLGPDWARPEGSRWRWGAFEAYVASLAG
jgi:hypothetical protein